MNSLEQFTGVMIALRSAMLYLAVFSLFCISLCNASPSNFYKSCTYSYDNSFYNPMWSNLINEYDMTELHYVGAVGFKCWARCQKECAALYGITLPENLKSTIQDDTQDGITMEDVDDFDKAIQKNVNIQKNINIIEANQDTIQECIISCQSGVVYYLSEIRVLNNDSSNASPYTTQKLVAPNNAIKSTCSTYKKKFTTNNDNEKYLIDDLNAAYPYNTEVMVHGGEQVKLEIHNDSTVGYPVGITEVGMESKPVMCGFKTSYISPNPYSIYSLGGWDFNDSAYAGCKGPGDCATKQSITTTNDPCQSAKNKKKCQKQQKKCKKKNKKSCSSVNETTTTEIMPINTDYYLGHEVWSARNASAYFTGQFVMDNSFFKIEYYGNYLYDCNYLQFRSENGADTNNQWHPYSCKNHDNQYSLFLYLTSNYNQSSWDEGELTDSILLDSTMFGRKELLNFQSTPVTSVSTSCDFHDESIVSTSDDITAVKGLNSLEIYHNTAPSSPVFGYPFMLRYTPRYAATAKINGNTYTFEQSSNGYTTDNTFSATENGTTKNASIWVTKGSNDTASFNGNYGDNSYSGTIGTQNSKVSITLDDADHTTYEFDSEQFESEDKTPIIAGLQGSIYTKQYPNSMRVVADMDAYLYDYLGKCREEPMMPSSQILSCISHAKHSQRCQFENEESLYIRYNRNAIPAVSFSGYLDLGSKYSEQVLAVGLRHFEPSNQSSEDINPVYWTDNVGGFYVVISSGNCVLSNGTGLEYAIIPVGLVSQDDESYAISVANWKPVQWQSGTNAEATISIPPEIENGYLFLRIRYGGNTNSDPLIAQQISKNAYGINVSSISDGFRSYLQTVESAPPNALAANGYVVGVTVIPSDDTDSNKDFNWKKYAGQSFSFGQDVEYNGTDDSGTLSIKDGHVYDTITVKDGPLNGQYTIQGTQSVRNIKNGQINEVASSQAIVVGSGGGDVLQNSTKVLDSQSGSLSQQPSSIAESKSSKKGGPICRFVTAYVKTLFGGAEILKRSGNSVAPSEAGAVGILFEGIVQNPMMLVIVRFSILLSIVIHALKFFVGMSEVTTKEVSLDIAKFIAIACLFSASSWKLFYDFLLKPFLGGMLSVTNITSGASLLENLLLCESCVNSCDTGIFVINNLDYIFHFIWGSMLKLLSLLRGFLTFCACILFMIGIYIYIESMLKAIMMYLYAITIMAILLIFAPVVISCILFDFSNKIFWSTIKHLFGVASQIVLIFSALSFLQVITFLLITVIFNFTVCKICIWSVWGLCILHGYTALSDAHYPAESQVGLFIMLQIFCFLAVATLMRNAVTFFSALGAKIPEIAKGVYGHGDGQIVHEVEEVVGKELYALPSKIENAAKSTFNVAKSGFNITKDFSIKAWDYLKKKMTRDS
ncbi:TrbL/VirB6 family protein [Candidatus Fokinia crypta]|nr:hypothetical protein [Candidatus Fokinia cryptica]